MFKNELTTSPTRTTNTLRRVQHRATSNGFFESVVLSAIQGSDVPYHYRQFPFFSADIPISGCFVQRILTTLASAVLWICSRSLPVSFHISSSWNYIFRKNETNEKEFFPDPLFWWPPNILQKKRLAWRCLMRFRTRRQSGKEQEQDQESWSNYNRNKNEARVACRDQPSWMLRAINGGEEEGALLSPPTTRSTLQRNAI